MPAVDSSRRSTLSNGPKTVRLISLPCGKRFCAISSDQETNGSGNKTNNTRLQESFFGKINAIITSPENITFCFNKT